MNSSDDEFEMSESWVKLSVNLIHHDCVSSFGSNKLNDVKMFLDTSIPLKSNEYSFTIEDAYPINSTRKISLILAELKKKSSIYCIKNWSLNNGLLRVSFVEVNENSPFAMLSPLGIIQYSEMSKDGTDYISFVLNEVNKESAIQLLNTLGEARVNKKTRIDERMLNFGSVLSNKEKLILGIAASLGYFDTPKRGHLKDIAKQSNISIAAVDGYIRSAVRKIVLNGFKD